MSDKLKKIDKEYCITDSSVNCYGFRLMTEGYDLPEFQRSPIGFYMHNRDLGVVLRWEDFRTDGDKVYAKPVINMSHPRGQQTLDEIENGFLNAASVGHIIALEWTEEPEHMLPGQTGPTVTKWYNKECSVVDIPGNPNAYSLYDADDNQINLADFTNSKIQKSMSKVLVLAATCLAALKLPADATQEQADKAINDLAAENARLSGDVTTLNAAKLKAEGDLASLKTTTAENEVKNILDAALTAKKTTVEFNKVLAAQYAGKPTELKAIVDAMPAYQSIVDNLKKEDDNSGLAAKFQNKTYLQLHGEDLLIELKEANPAHFAKLETEYKASKTGK